MKILASDIESVANNVTKGGKTNKIEWKYKNRYKDLSTPASGSVIVYSYKIMA